MVSPGQVLGGVLLLLCMGFRVVDGVRVVSWSNLQKKALISALVGLQWSSLPLPSFSEEVVAPSVAENKLVQKAFSDFDAKKLDLSESEFSDSITRWREMHRPRDELVSLLRARGNVRLDKKDFVKAIDDFNECIEMMSVDGENEKGAGVYPEYADAFVSRGLANEGLGHWKEALQDYDKAVSLWSTDGKETNLVSYKRTSGQNLDYTGINPYVLTFRGNVLAKLVRFL